MASVVYIGLGSNLGDRKKNITQAIKKINVLKKTKVIRISKIIETFPVGGPVGQPKYLNAAIKISTGLSPQELLKELKKIEQELGRRKSVRWGSRIIDLDILIYGDRIINTKNLTVPHPRMFEREFVLEPLREVIS